VVALVSGSAATPRTLPIREAQVAEKAQVDKQAIAQQRAQQAQLKSLAQKVATFRTSTWSCQDTLGISRTHASASVWALPQSIAYRGWVAEQWQKNTSSCLKLQDQRTIPATNDWLTAVKLVQRIYPGTSDWMLFISHREGGWGGFVMNHQGSGAGGQMQFMASTYYAYNDAAFADARQRGFIVDESLNRWESAFGQALTAGYMKYTGRSGCHWAMPGEC
jgi:hypothetical protein